MKKQILTGIGVLLLGSSMAFAAPQTAHTNFNASPAYQQQQIVQRDQRDQRNQTREPQQQYQRVRAQAPAQSRRVPQSRKHHTRKRTHRHESRQQNWQR